MTEIKSAYRFIPVEKDEEYFSPEWRNLVSMDIPFKDNVSGEINYTLKANTALFIKGSDGDFCNVNGEYFIPGTSIKGCIRSVLEILSFGHLDESRVQDNDGFPFRDISDRNGYMNKMNKVYCGWLDNEGRIHNWGIPKHVKYSELTALFNCNRDEYKKLNIFDKYRLYKGHLTQYFSGGRRLPNARNFDNRLFCTIEESGNSGTIIFSGSIETKESDFVLLDNDCNVKDDLPVNDTTLKRFKLLYPYYDEKIPYNSQKNGKPVFFTKDNNNNVLTIGLSYLHKYYAESTIRKAIPENMKGGGLDLADVMFGSAKYNLRGRIQFGRATMIEGKKLYDDNTSLLAVLGSPQASYYPMYLQRGTWDNNNCIISGIKRYPIKPVYDVAPFLLTKEDRQKYESKFGPLPSDESKILSYQYNGNSMIPKNEKDNNHNFDTITCFKPLREKSKFRGQIHFFNLRQEELGALLSALTFHGHSECKHSLGQAKALGYGSVSLSIDKIICNNEESNDISSFQNRYLQLFANLMKQQYPNWEKSKRLKELFAMAKGFTEDELIDVFTPMLLSQFGRVKSNYLKGNDEFSSYTSVLSQNGIFPSSEVRKEKPLDVSQAEIVVLNNYVKQAKLLSGKDLKPKELVINSRDRLSPGNRIEVEIKRDKGGNINKLIYKRKI